MAAHVKPSDYAVFLETRRAAEAGQAKAQYNLGLMYANGVGVEQDPKQALRWYQKSADKGFSAAQYILAGKYAAGKGVDRDIRQALSWYLKASEKGNSRALFKLGQMLSTPQEELASQCFEQAAAKGMVEAQMIVGARDEAASGKGGRAVKENSWYQKAAESGFPAAQYIVGTHYHTGKWGKQDIQQAIVWYRKAARQGFAAAQSQLGQLYLRGEGVGKDYRQAASWLVKAAEQGDVEAQYQLALLHTQGLGVAVDVLEAEKWLLKAADQGDVRAQLHLARLCEADRPDQAIELYSRAAAQGNLEASGALGSLYADGLLVGQDIDKAVRFLHQASERGDVSALVRLAQLLDRESLSMTTTWYRRAAAEGNPLAQCVIGLRLMAGQGIAKDEQEALFWLMLSAEKGLPEAQHAVAEAFRAQGNSPENLQEAVAWYRKAAKQGFSKSQSALGSLYAHGEGVPKDNRQAASWWLKAAEQGDSDAQFNLGQLFEKGGGATAERHAEQWYLRAIERGDSSRASLALVKLYARNQSAQAAAWFEQAAAQGVALAQFLHGNALQGEADGALSAGALHHYLQAAAQGHSEALLRLAELSREQPEQLARVCSELAGEAGAGAPEERVENEPLSRSTAENTPNPFEICRKQAEAGDPRAQWSLAVMYARGEYGQARDEAQAGYWYRQSALAGFPAAQAALALMLATGQGVPQDGQEATHWWKKAAEQGDAESQYNVALMYEKGMGVTQDHAVAAFWLQKAAEQGIVIAQTRLGLAFATGRLGQPDLVEAFAWFAVAASAGNEAAQANREHAESLMSPQQLKEGRRRADQLVKKLTQRRARNESAS